MTRTVSETAKVGATIGNAVVATDADNDPLLYTLVDYDNPLQGDIDGDGDTTSTGLDEADYGDIDGDGETTSTSLE